METRNLMIIVCLVLAVAGEVSAKHTKTFAFGLSEITIKKANLISIVPFIGKEYEVNFDVLPTGFNAGWRSVLHFTAGDQNAKARGDRIPAIWFQPTSSVNKKGLHFCSDVNGNKDYCYNTAPFIELNKWWNIKVTQKYLFGNGYFYSIQVNGHHIHTIRNNKAAAYKHVRIYASDKWYPAQQGKIKNLVIKTSW